MGRCWFYPTTPPCRSASLLCALMQFPHFELPLATTHHFPRQLRLPHTIAPATKVNKIPTWAAADSDLSAVQQLIVKNSQESINSWFHYNRLQKNPKWLQNQIITRFNVNALLVRILYSNVWTDLESLRSSWLVVSSARAKLTSTELNCSTCREVYKIIFCSLDFPKKICGLLTHTCDHELLKRHLEK